MSIHSIEEVRAGEQKPLTLSGEKLKRYEYCGFTAESIQELEELVTEFGLQWHPSVVIDTTTGQKVGV